MARSSVRRPFATRLLRGGVIALILVAVLWTGLWFAAASWVEGEFDARTTQLAREGRADIDCGRRGVSGYPFAFRFDCDADVMVDTDRAEIAFTSMKAGASVFSPGTIRSSVVGPANVALAPGITAIADWTDATLTIDDAFGERSADLAVTDLALDLPRLDVAAETGSLRLAPNGFDLDIDFTATGATVMPSGRPAVTVPRLFLDASLERMHRRLLVRLQSFDPRQGMSGRIERMGLDTRGEGRLLVSGPFAVSPEGLISGEFTIAVRDGAAVGALIAQFVDDPSTIDGALVGLEALGERRTIDGVEMRAIELTAVDGRLPLGFVTIDLPPVWRAR